MNRIFSFSLSSLFHPSAPGLKRRSIRTRPLGIIAGYGAAVALTTHGRA